MSGYNMDAMIKYGSLIVMIVQNLTVVLLMHATRTSGADKYYVTTAVFFSEAMKFIMSLLLILHEQKFNLRNYIQHLKQELINKPGELLKISIPALLYTFQNNILYVAVENLEAAVFQVLYQLKILTAAVLSVWMLKRVLSGRQWFSLMVLFVGVALVQLSVQQEEKEDAPAESVLSAHDVAMKLANPMLGLICVLLGSCSSGLAGVYFEKLLKESKQSMWMRNVQLSFWSMLIAALAVASQNGAEIAETGIFHGYTASVWGVVMLQGAGGLVVAVVVKYADNIAKGFATSIATVLNTLISMALFGFVPTPLFVFGALQVCAATYLYGTAPPPVSNDVTADASVSKVAEPSPADYRVTVGEEDSDNDSV